MEALYVDDEPSFLEQARIFLERESEKLNVETTVSAEKALRLLDEKNFDIIISDYQMPEFDGLDLLESIRKDKKSDIPFIMFTGKGREEVAMEALNLGADRYLQKGGNPKSQYGVLAQAIIQEVEHWFTKKKLKSNERRYRDLAEKALVGIYIIQDDVFEYVNPKFCKIFEYERKELIGKNYLDLVTPEHREMVENGVSERQKGEGEATQYRFNGLKSTGEIIPVEVQSVPSTYNGEPAVQGTLIERREQ